MAYHRIGEDDWYNSIPRVRRPEEEPYPWMDPDFDVNKLKVNEIKQPGGGTLAKIPEIPGRVFPRKDEGRSGTYIVFVIDKYYDEEKHQTRNEKVIIGQDCGSLLPGMMFINKNYHKYFDTEGNLFNDPMIKRKAKRAKEAEERKAREAAERKAQEALEAAAEGKQEKETEAVPEKDAAEEKTDARNAEASSESMTEGTAEGSTEETAGDTTEETADALTEEEKKKAKEAEEKVYLEALVTAMREGKEHPDKAAREAVRLKREKEARSVDEIKKSLLEKEKELEDKIKLLEDSFEEVKGMREAKLLSLVQKEEEHLNLLKYFLDRYEMTIREQAKRRPDNFMRATQIRTINEVLREIRGLFEKSEFYEYLHLAEEPIENDLENHPGTTYGEMALLLSAYDGIVVHYQFRKLFEKDDEVDKKQEEDE